MATHFADLLTERESWLLNFSVLLLYYALCVLCVFIAVPLIDWYYLIVEYAIIQ